MCLEVFLSKKAFITFIIFCSTEKDPNYTKRAIHKTVQNSRAS